MAAAAAETARFTVSKFEAPNYRVGPRGQTKATAAH